MFSFSLLIIYNKTLFEPVQRVWSLSRLHRTSQLPIDCEIVHSFPRWQCTQSVWVDSSSIIERVNEIVKVQRNKKAKKFRIPFTLINDKIQINLAAVEHTECGIQIFSNPSANDKQLTRTHWERERESGKLWIGAIAGMVHIIMLMKLCVNSTDDNSNKQQPQHSVHHNNRYDFCTKRSICGMPSGNAIVSNRNIKWCPC